MADRWILSRLSAVIAEVDGLLEQFEFGKACDALYHFAWDEFCDWYLELAKVPLAAAQADGATAADAAAADRTKNVLGFVLDQMLRLLHPVMPFVTDELWTALTGQDSVMMAAWPTFAGEDKAAEAEVASLMRLVTEIRRFRSDQGLRPGQRVPARLAGIAATPLADHEPSIRSLLRLTNPADRERRRVQRLRVTGGRGRHRGARPGRDGGRGGRAGADGEGSRGRPQGGGADGRQAREPGVHRQGAGRRGGQVPPAPGRRGSRHRAAGSPPRVAPLMRGRPAPDQNAITTRSRLTPVDIEERLREVELEVGSRRAEHQISPTLDRVAALVGLLGDPHRAYPVVHVTGTNGKTSTTRMIETLLRERGLRTGRFTSPHLVSMRERIAVDGVPLSAERFIELYDEIAPYVQLVDDQQPAPMSFFEILTGMMFAAFADAPVDVAVIEVGLGGRWDATNVADGAVAVVTPVAMDHMQWLGNTIEEIATEKAGIIKPGAIAVLAQQQVEAAEVLLERVSLVGATVAREGFEFGVLNRELALGGQQLTLQGLRGTYDDVFLPLFGAHQASNAAGARWPRSRPSPASR